jgi:hypothetical protein
VLLDWQFPDHHIGTHRLGVSSGASRFLLEQRHNIVQTPWSQVSVSLGHHQGFVSKRLGNVLELRTLLPEPTSKRVTQVMPVKPVNLSIL